MGLIVLTAAVPFVCEIKMEDLRRRVQSNLYGVLRMKWRQLAEEFLNETSVWACMRNHASSRLALLSFMTINYLGHP